MKKTILLVEDDFLNRRLLKKVLLEIGYAVLEAMNIAEVREIVQKEHLDLIILDINLGENEQNGISIGHEIHSKYRIPFIYLTAYDNNETISQAIATSPSSYLTKPFKNVDLLTSVGIALKQHENVPKHQPFILVKDGEYTIELPMDDIDFIESDGNYLLFHSGAKVFKNRSTIKQILEQLSENVFVQTHRAYIVNKDKITKFGTKSVIVNNTIIPVSKSYADNLSKFVKR